MKPILFILGAILSLPCIAQQNTSITHNINDNGKTLSIKVDGTVNGRPVSYYKEFDVSGMQKDERDALKRRVYDSLGLPEPVAPRPALQPHRVTLELVAPVAPVAPIEPNEPAVPVVSSKSPHTELYTVGGKEPYTKEIRYDPATGQLYMKYRITRNGEEASFEKSIDAKDKSKEERNQIIRKYEKEIRMPHPEAI